MEVKEEKAMERERERKIPVFTVLKNGAILKNIFVVDSADSFSPEGNGGGGGGGDRDAEETLVLGRHPDCNIMLTHPSISRFHLQIHSIPSRQKLFVTDLSSVHGTWVSDQKVEPGTRAEVKEGDTIRIGGSTRIYRLHWIPLSRAYDTDNPFVSPVDIYTAKEQDEENGMLEAENLVATHETSVDEKLVPDENEVPSLDMTSDGAFSLIPNEDPDSTVKEIPVVPLASPSNLPLARASTEIQKHLLNEDAQTSPEFVTDIVEAGEKSKSSCSAREQQSGVCTDAIYCPLFGELTVEEADNQTPHQEGNGESEVVSRQVMAVSEHSFPGDELLSGTRTKTKEIEGPLLAWQPLSDIQSEVDPARDQNQNSGMKTETEEAFDESSNLSLSEGVKESEPRSFPSATNQNPSAVMHVGSEGRSEEADGLSRSESHENDEKRGFISATLAVEESFYSSQLAEEVPSDKTGSKENQTPQSQAVRGVLSEMENSRGFPLKSAKRSTTCNVWSRRGKSASVLQIRTNRSEGKPKIVGVNGKAESQKKEVTNDKSILQSLHAVSEKLEPEIFTPDKENLTPDSHILKRLQEIGDIKESKSSSKAASVPFSSKMFRSDDIQMEENIVGDSEGLEEPEIFTPDKENLTPNSHMLKRLQEVGKLEENKGSSKATRSPFSSKVVLSQNIHFEENIIPTEKENQMVGVLREQKPEQRNMSSKLKLKQEAVAPKRKTKRAPFQPLLEKSPVKIESYAGASSAAARSSSFADCSTTRSTSILSYGKSKMKWTIVVDTSSLLDSLSRRSLQLLQGLKGTQVVIPRTVLRELDGLKKRSSLLFRRTTEVSSVLEWIEESMAKTKSWVHLQGSSEETGPTAPTPPASPLSPFSDSVTSDSAFPFSVHQSMTEMVSPTSEDHVLECALLYRRRNNDGYLVLLSNDVTLKIKAMAEGVICETAREFYESLVNPFSERFMWAESSPRGQTWCHLDDVVLRERYKNRSFYTKKSSKGESTAKGLKLILLHNSHYGQPVIPSN